MLRHSLLLVSATKGFPLWNRIFGSAGCWWCVCVLVKPSAYQYQSTEPVTGLTFLACQPHGL